MRIPKTSKTARAVEFFLDGAGSTNRLANARKRRVLRAPSQPCEHSGIKTSGPASLANIYMYIYGEERDGAHIQHPVMSGHDSVGMAVPPIDHFEFLKRLVDGNSNSRFPCGIEKTSANLSLLVSGIALGAAHLQPHPASAERGPAAGGLASAHFWQPQRPQSSSEHPLFHGFKLLLDPFSEVLEGGWPSSSKAHILKLSKPHCKRHTYCPSWRASTCTGCDLGNDTPASPASFTTVEGSSTSPAAICLMEFSWRGIHLFDGHLVQFLEAVCPGSSTLADAHLEAGTCTSIFDDPAGADSHVTHHHLGYIRVGKALVHLEAPGSPKFRYMRPVGAQLAHAIRKPREGADTLPLRP
ncbi:hypothetical protein CDD83_8351 [Cordyceps sp. RAO-2017]|nr:hypothetical protein CDD83_8351 [Cordyceps sp. RAO-2017]